MRFYPTCKICILILISISFFFIGCNKKDETNINKKDELVYANTKDIRIVNPHLYSGEMAAQNMLFESLVINTIEGIKPHLAQNWEISLDGKTYIFYLRKDVKFSDGEIFNAHIVKKNMDAILKNRQRHAWLELINKIDSYEVIDDFTFKLTLNHPYYPTLTELAMTRPFRFISPKCFIDNGTKDGVNCYIGTGMWILKEYKKNEFATFTINEHYWGEKPKIKNIKWRVMPDHQTIILALQKGEVDLIFGSDGDMINLDVFNKLQKDKQYVTILSNPTGSRTILINTKRSITNDANIRQALQYAIDKKAIVSGILNDSENIAYTLFAPTTPYANVSLEKKEFNKEKANDILNSAGWIIDKKSGYRVKNQERLTLKLYFNANNAQEKTISEYIQSNLKDIGIELKIYGEETQTFLDRQKNGDFDLQYALSWGIPYDPQSYISSWRIASHGDYQAQLGLAKKEWLDSLISKVLVETDDKKRVEMYKDLLNYIHDENVYIPISYSRAKAVFRPNLKGVSFNISQYEIPFEKMFFE